MKTSTGIALAFLTAALLTTGCDDFAPASARDTVHRSFRVGSGGTLFLNSNTGSIDVNSGFTDDVRVDVERETRGATNMEAEQRLREARIEFRQIGNDVYVEAKLPGDRFSGFNWGHRLRLRFVLTVPSKYNLDLRTGGGSIEVSDLEGTVTAQTSGGSLRFGNIKGAVTGRTSGGSITLDGGSGPLDVNTSGGSINIGKVYGSVKAHTSGGSISVDEVQGQIQASTSGGGVNATITRQPEGNCELSTSGGSIRARLKRDLNLDLSAKTGGGSVRVNVPATIQGEIRRDRFEGRMNQGGPRLTLHTSGGGISIDEY